MESAAPIRSQLETVRGARLFFAHHSVGQNLLDGVQALSSQAGVPLKIAPLTAARVPGPVWLEGSGGTNKDPASKIDEFGALLTGPSPLKVELAFLKLCYVDFHPRTDVESLFARYHDAMTALQRQRPEVTFGHVTVPLTARPRELRARVRRALGLEVWEDAANARRCEFNQRLRERFADRPVFDLARAEATRLDGTPQSFRLEGITYASLVGAYTDDGGHLNALGQRRLGGALLAFVAGALRGRAGSSP